MHEIGLEEALNAVCEAFPGIDIEILFPDFGQTTKAE